MFVTNFFILASLCKKVFSKSLLSRYALQIVLLAKSNNVNEEIPVLISFLFRQSG
jgi:hypothetical protein